MIEGKLIGLPSRYLVKLEKLERRSSKGDDVISIDLAKVISEISYELKRQIAVMLNRLGGVEYVILGDHDEIVIPILSRFKLIPGRLRGLRLIRTDLKNDLLDDDDYTDLALLRLDCLTVLAHDEAGRPKSMQTTYLLPPNDDNKLYDILPDRDPYNQKVHFHDFIESLDDEMISKAVNLNIAKDKVLAVITGSFRTHAEAEINMQELKELARSANVEVIEIYPQIKSKVDPKYIIGEGKLKEIVIKMLSGGAEYLIYDNELTPSQSRAITEYTEIKVIDRTQLILDIFAKRAKSNDGKIIVELAQLKYILPRLGLRDDALSRLTGGIGGKGPGETKLEIDKRRVTDRIALLSGKLKRIEQSRGVRRVRRIKNDTPVVSIIGYTNAGKSTLINNLTKSDIYADDLMFATLDTSSKRIRFPEDKELIITDTVGFIRDLPKNLESAFKSTLEEIDESDLFLHIVDISDPMYKKHIIAVEKVLTEISKSDTDKILIFNKIDLIDQEQLTAVESEYPSAVFISATDKLSYKTMIDKLWYYFFKEEKSS